jgi:SAM-dependent methyltransferase
MESTTTSDRETQAGTRALKKTLLLRRVHEKIRTPVPLFRILHRNEEKFKCPICGYAGPFANFNSYVGVRKHAMCPQCVGLERHRLQYLTMKAALSTFNGRDGMRMLHIAPEPFFKQMFRQQFTKYETADLFMEGVDHRVDICNMPFEDAAYDFVFASHVLEHVQDDRRAIKEIRRVLRPNGIAILPVPIVSDKTVEYFKSNPFEEGHVRAPGPDYFGRYKEHFCRVEVYSSTAFPGEYQLFVHEDRSMWPTAECPLRPSMQGTKHIDLVPVCYA